MGTEISIRTGIESTIRAAALNYRSLNDTGNGMAYFMARVSFILLDDSDEQKFSKYGGWKAIGTIECTTFVGNDSNTDVISALPINPNNTVFPLVNEIVLIIKSVSYNAQKEETNYIPQYYYSSVIPGWNSIEHNAIPNKITSQLETGLFKPTGKINRIIKAPGDISLEGRSGNFIRLGSSVDGFNSPFRGTNRAPLLTIVNGVRASTDSKIALFEDINLDGSSLYMLSGQNVGFSISSVNYNSFNYKIDQDIISNYIQPTKGKEEDLNNVKDIKLDKKEVVNLINPVNAKEESLSEEDEINLRVDEKDLPENRYEQTSVVFRYDDLDYFEDIDLPEEPNEVKSNQPQTINQSRKNNTKTPTVSNQTNNKKSTSTSEEIELVPSGKTKYPKPESPYDNEVKESVLNKNKTPIPYKKGSPLAQNDFAYMYPIPWYKQSNSESCFVTSIAMLFSGLSKTTVTESEIRKANNNSDFVDGAAVAKKYGYNYSRTALPRGRAESYYAIVEVCKKRKDEYGRVKPFILQRKGVRKYHFVVVVGVTPDNVVICQDPGSDSFSDGVYLREENLLQSGGSLRFFDK